MNFKITFKNTIAHFKKICSHKRWVYYYCREAGITWRGIVHDLSKFSPTEFWESVRYFQGDSSPIDACKKENGISKAWLHHKGRNSHHYEYWQDNFDNGGIPLLMPYEDCLEMLCDYLGAGRAYYGESFTLQKEREWWKNKTKTPLAMHWVNKYFIDYMLDYFAYLNEEDFSIAKEIYRQKVMEYAIGLDKRKA